MARTAPRQSEVAWSAIDATADYIVATRGADVPLLSNGIAWLMDGVGAVPLAKRAKCTWKERVAPLGNRSEFKA